ncbi:BRO1-domain-containing protein [Testicularia cyperi]|uniref:BRO1-domain-containing protein n=1 Tax=Testicularia cyperi TaxID=1882483 RepID=A0A317XHG9_9BASI|nr:BRO1-domain-containing protein [Testicularia cyperi]
MPKNILAIPQKRTPALSKALSSAIRTYISQHYTDTHPDAFANDVRDFCRHRDDLASIEVHTSAIDTALRYHAQLVFFATKFPSNIGLSFPWTLSCPSSLPSWTSGIQGALESSASAESGPQSGTSYATADTVAHPDTNYERANVLFTLASLYSALGCAEARSDKESIKRATAWFQSAAGVVQHILDNLVGEIRHLKPPSSDFNESLLRCLRDLMLAQAQECFWQKAVVDKLKDATIAKLAEKVSEFYASALEAATGTAEESNVSTDALARPTLPSGWESHITVKRYHFAAAAQFRKACDDLASNRYGDELGRLKVAEIHVKKALDSARRGVSEAITSDLKSLQQIIATNIQRGTRDNDLIYLEPVTSATNLAPIQAAAMVKPVVPAEIADPIPLLRERPAPALGKPLFAELVPYAVHMAISIYDDRKDSLVRDRVGNRRDELDAIATSTLQSLNLPGSLQALEQPMGLPPALLRKHEEVVAEGGIDRLHRIARDVARIAVTDRDILSEALALIEAEEREDENVRASFTSKGWSRPSSNQINQELKAQAAQYHDTLIKAAASDEVVRKKLDDWQDLIGVLSVQVADLEAFVPTSNPSIAASSSAGTGQTSDAQVHAIRALRVEMENLDDLLDSRAACLTEAKALASQDDIRSLVMREAAAISSSSSRVGSADTASMSLIAADFEDLFDRQLAKYSRFVQDLETSAASQTELLSRITERNQEFVKARKSDPRLQQRERALQNLDAAYVKYRELSSNLIEGLEFYNSLAKILSAFRDQIKDWARARQIDLHYLVHQLGATSISSDAQQSESVPQHHNNVPQSSPQPQPASPTKRTTRSSRSKQSKQQQQSEPPQPSSLPPSPPQPQQPQWGAFPGGKIQFADD